ncbi:hypothetical protein BvCms454_00735 [Escherichia coli]|nr:hypothetical protein BvCms454_00735 [Escherichia coli]GDP63502.1 hypothetical protein BvCmsOUNP025_02558 [Escherichia coli]
MKVKLGIFVIDVKGYLFVSKMKKNGLLEKGWKLLTPIFHYNVVNCI